MLSKYILTNKNTLFDRRNIRLALVKDDLLGEGFDVTAFHRSQVSSLLQNQFIPLHHDAHTEEITFVSTSSSPGLHLTYQHLQRKSSPLSEVIWGMQTITHNEKEEDDLKNEEMVKDPQEVQGRQKALQAAP
jgi:hypothetical protein